MKYINRVALSLAVLLLSSIVLCGQQNFVWKGSRILMDSTINLPVNYAVKEIVDRYKPEMDEKMQEVIGHTEKELRSSRPESELSNFAVASILSFAQEVTNSNIDFAVTNFGGIRAALPAGDVRLYDIFSIFPFENYLVVVDMTGESVLSLFKSFAKNRVEVFSDEVRVVINRDKGVLKDIKIGGKSVDLKKVYRVATIDFLLSGGDNVIAFRDAVSVQETGYLIRDAIIDKIRRVTEQGEVIASPITGRVKYEK